MKKIIGILISLFLFSQCKSSDETWLNEAKIRLEKGELKSALDACNKALEKNPGYAEAYNLKGVILFQQKNIKEAELNYAQALRIKPSYYQASLNLVSVKMEKNDWKNALPIILQTEKMAPDSNEVFLKKGIIVAALGKPEEAIQNFGRAINLQPRNTDALYNRGNIYFQQKKYLKAKQDFEKSLEINPNFGKAYYALGLSYYYTNEKEKACLSIKQALRLNYPGAQQASHQLCE
jgi:tetratricopeptide (TPR) repeat protein